MIIWVTKAGARNWDELRASALPAAAGGLVVIAWFVPLLVYATDGFVWRFGIWGADDFTSSGQPGSQGHRNRDVMRITSPSRTEIPHVMRITSGQIGPT